MKLLAFEIENRILDNNLVEYTNTIKTLLFQADEAIFDLIDIDDDKIFLEPTLFFYFSEKKAPIHNTPLMQLLWGYITNEKKPGIIEVRSDVNGFINLPNYGYFKYKPASTLQLLWDGETVHFMEDNVHVNPVFISDIYVNGSSIRVCQHVPEWLWKDDPAKFIEPIPATITGFLPALNSAWSLMKKIVPEYCSYIEKTNREIALINCYNKFSLAAFGYFGTAFLNVQNEPHDEVFFIDDIAHQCGHILFYPLSMPFTEYLSTDHRTPMKEFTQVEWEERDIYGCFHGLFTYTTILHCLNECLDQNIFTGKQQHEALGRLAFYMDKFRKDLASMNDPLLLSDKGFEYFDMFKAGYDRMYEKYKSIIRKMNFSNQYYLFNYSSFNTLNPISKWT
ncbi:hypothetical protein [Chitinophaga sp. Cy-1792]|uniref:hypothetical protein n=1 Tax=Chitinophaga sp. Cy-1792 TaxID=2608339 RepID=UPI00142461C3|nr:hypothetical protein [Chitinophaga sp. Cy-1792]NIG56552.1 hypothetical protein [Chitinophaga sp. Cy-1792]